MNVKKSHLTALADAKELMLGSIGYYTGVDDERAAEIERNIAHIEDLEKLVRAEFNRQAREKAHVRKKRHHQSGAYE